MSTLEIAQEYRKDTAAYGITQTKGIPHTYSFEGYIYGALTAEFLRKIEGPITQESLARVLEKIKNYPFKGLILTYDPAHRQIANSLWLEVSSGEWIKQNI